ncbi:hypothetical protein GpSGHVEth060 [Glossina pallidipes salivary gland hypertrophy virus]|uniref:Uncharacterized protein n=1 Tax=Glossina hytrovirus (isolate Glossina pallidipes/Ethiopia/Seibersdorf/-) TaxID=379529 RepID=A0A0Y0G7C6_GHVS|nr:hypothetical protein GpSGHVEth060 [Glossina pallidipes salivary gland hypertrophy virus]
MDESNNTDDESKIACMKAVYDVIGWNINPTIDNYNDRSTLVEETILLMRAFGYNSSEDNNFVENKE